MFGYFKIALKSVALLYPRYICKKEYKEKNIYTFNERPVEFRFVFEQLSKLYPDKILDVGTGTTSLPHLMRNCGFNVTAIDNIKDYWPTGMFNRHYYVIDDDITNTKLNEKFDVITCISVLEHIENADLAIKNMFDLLNPNGHLILTFPYNEEAYSENVYDRDASVGGEGASYVCQAFSKENLNQWMKDNDGYIVEQEFWQFFKGEFWTEGGDVLPPVKSTKEELHQLTCLLIKKN